MIDINNYDRVNKKIILYFNIAAFLCLVFIIVSISNLKDDMDFYQNSKQANCLVTNKKNRDNKNIILVSYKIDKKLFSGEILVSNDEFNNIHIGDKMEIFYNKENPTECRTSTKSVISILIIIAILLTVMIACILTEIIYYSRIRTNKKLIYKNNTVDAKFLRLEFKNSIFGNQRINYVYCKAIVNGEKKNYKSIGFKKKPKPLNDTSIIRVYVDNNKYLVNVYDIMQE